MAEAACPLEGAYCPRPRRRGGQVKRGGPAGAPAGGAGGAGGGSGGGGGKKGSKAGLVTITKKDRGRGKHITILKGLEFYDIKPKEAASAIGKKFGVGASATKGAAGEPEIDVQGDLVYDLEEALPEMFGIPEDAIVAKD